MPSLRCLHLNPAYMSAEWTPQVKAMTALQSLQLHRIHHSSFDPSTEPALRPVMLAPLTALTRLALVESRVHAKSVRFLASLPSLVSLELIAASLDDDAVQPLRCITSLSELVLDSNLGAGVSADGISALVQLTVLTKLSLAGNRKLCGGGLQPLRALTDLRVLSLACTECGDPAACAVSPLTQLTELSVTGCGLYSAGMLALTCLVSLRTLDVGCNFLDDQGLQLLTVLTRLRCLTANMSGCCSADVRALAALTQLTFLDISDNYISDAGAVRVLTALTALRNLNMTGNLAHLDSSAMNQRLLELEGGRVALTLTQRVIDCQSWKLLTAIAKKNLIDIGPHRS